jgi:hypothetical protein
MNMSFTSLFVLTTYHHVSLIVNTVIGMQITRAHPVEDKNSKWYTPRGMFNGTVYPPYCSGTSYVISGDAIGRLYNTTLVTPSIHTKCCTNIKGMQVYVNIKQN